MPKQLPLIGAFSVSCFLELRINSREANTRSPHIKGRGDKGLSNDDRGSRERQAESQGSEQRAEDSLPAECDQKGESGYRRREGDRQVDDQFDRGAPTKWPSGERIGQWGAGDSGEESREAAGHKADAQCGESRRRENVRRKVFGKCAPHECGDRRG